MAVGRFFAIPVLVVMFMTGTAGLASAGAPTIQRIPVNETFVDETLTAACGVEVTLTEVGHVIVRTFERSGPGPTEVFTINLAIKFTAGSNTYRVRDVGVNVTRIEPDGTAILSIVGQIPFDFKGALKIDLDTGEVVHEPQHSTVDDIDKACAILTS